MKSTAIAVSLPRLPSRSRLTARLADFVTLMMIAPGHLNPLLAVFFLHITTGADNTNNVLALAFGILIVFLVIAGSLWIMANLNHDMMPMDQFMQMQR